MALLSTYFNRVNLEGGYGMIIPGWTSNDYLSNATLYFDDRYSVNGKYKGKKLVVRLLNSLVKRVDESPSTFIGKLTEQGYAILDIPNYRNNSVYGRPRFHYEPPYYGDKAAPGYRANIAADQLYKWLVALRDEPDLAKAFHTGIPPAVLVCDGLAGMGALTLVGYGRNGDEEITDYVRGVVAISPCVGTLNRIDRRRMYSEPTEYAIQVGGLIRKSTVPGFVLIPTTDPDINHEAVRTLQVFNNDKFIRVLSPKVAASTWPYGNTNWLVDRVKETMMMPPLKKAPRDQDGTHRTCYFTLITPGASLENPPIKSLNPNTRVMPASITKLLTLMTAYTLDPKWATKDFEVQQVDIRTGSGYNLKIGDIIKGEHLMMDALIPSSNTAAQCIARSMGEMHLNGGDAEFVAKMNELAKVLGVSNATNFVNASGTANSGQYSTAFDLAKLIIAVQVKPEYSGIRQHWNTSDTTIKVHGGPAVRDISITNSFPDAGDEYISGVKTGTIGTVFNVACILNLPGGRKAVYVSMDSDTTEARADDLRMNYQRQFDAMVLEPTKWGITT